MHSIQPTRRELLGGLAAAGLTATLPGVRAADKPADARRIDVHHHFYSPGLEFVAVDAASLKTMKEWTPARSIEAMDKGGVATTFLSGPMGDSTKDTKDEAARDARIVNDYGAKLVADHKGRFGLFASLPLPHIDESLKAIEYALDTLKADGLFLRTNYGNHWLGDKAYEKVYEELNRRKAVVYTHPTDSPCCLDMQADTPTNVVEWNTHTSRAIWGLINDGVRVGKSYPSMATRFPDITFIWSHAGGSLLGLVGRFVGFEVTAESLAKGPAKNSRFYHLRRFFYDTAGSYNPVQMPALKTLVGGSQIVFGSDYPFGNPAFAAQRLAECGFTADELRGVERDNALKFLTKWK